MRTLCVPRRDPSALSLFTPGPPLPAPGCRPGAAHSTPQGGLAALDPPRRLGTPPSRTASSSSSTARRPHGLGGARRARRGVHTRCTPGCRSPSRRGGGLPATPRRSTGPSAASFQNQNGSPEGLQEPLTRWSPVPAAESESVRPPLASGLTLAVALPLPLPLDPDAPAAGVAFARLLVPAAGASDGRFTAARGGT